MSLQNFLPLFKWDDYKQKYVNEWFLLWSYY